MTTPDSNGTVRSLQAAHAAQSITAISYVGNKRYMRALATFGGTHATGTVLGATVIKAYPSILPAA